ncbi:cysteine dioxygenase [Pseudalkalibacillus decolorationis]|uniref:cysteine dioxygenase n=1 Tax=Pseudalkalibacillus decolorationis TaxID=163879 RepID=UPI0021483B15|nr:cysteine dioxygenase family protein [Pseudalkalibacillus decolorationis]
MDFLKNFFERLEGLDKHSLSNLNNVIETIDFTKEDLSPYITEPDDLPYGRNVIYRSDEFEVIVLHFPSHTKTPMHDHGRSIGCGVVIKGEMTEVSYKNREGALEFVSKSKATQDETFHVPNQHIHVMENNTDDSLVTLHVYSPPLSGVNYFKTRLVEENVSIS